VLEPDAQDLYEQGLEQFGDMLGIDLQGDLIDQFSGTFLSYSSSSSDLPTMDGVPLTTSMTMIMDMDDTEAVGKAVAALIQFIESSFLGEGFLDAEEQTWGQSWSFDMDEGSAVMMAVDSRSMILTTEPGALGEYHALQAEPNPENSVLANAEVKKVLAAFDEVPMAFMSVPGYVETMATMMDMMFESDEFEEDPDLDEITDFMSVAEDILLDHLEGWVGYTLQTTANRMQVVLKTR